MLMFFTPISAHYRRLFKEGSPRITQWRYFATNCTYEVALAISIIVL